VSVAGKRYKGNGLTLYFILQKTIKSHPKSDTNLQARDFLFKADNHADDSRRQHKKSTKSYQILTANIILKIDQLQIRFKDIDLTYFDI